MTPTSPNPLAVNLPLGAAVVNFTFDVNCSTNSFANQLAPQQIVLAFADSLATTDPHVVDPNNGNNTLAPIIYAFWNKLPFNPVYTMTIDSNTGPSEPVVIPAADNCLVNGNPFPLGAYCEMYQTTSLPAGNAIGLAITNIPQPAFSIASVTRFSVAWQMARRWRPSDSGEPVLRWHLRRHDQRPVPECQPDGRRPPAPTGGFDDDGDGLIDEDPLGGGNTDGDADTDEDGAYVPGIPAEGPNSNLAADLANPNVFPTGLLADSVVQSFIAGGAPLWARYGYRPGRRRRSTSWSSTLVPRTRR